MSAEPRPSPRPTPAPVNDFWTRKSKTVEELAAEQGVKPITSVDDLRADFWPEDESADDIDDFITQQRAADRMSDA